MSEGDREVAPGMAGRPDRRAVVDDATRRQRHLWALTLRARSVGIVILAATVLLAADELGDDRFWVSGALLLGVLPYNLAFELELRRRGRLPAVLPFTDQALAAAFLIAAPAIAPGILLAMLALVATAAVAFGRTVAAEAALVGLVGAAVGVALSDVPEDWGWVLVWAVSAGFVILVAGTVAEVERDLRSRHAELMGGIDAIVWEQLTSRPTTLYVTGRAEELFGFPAEAWAEPGFWRSCVHPDDHERAAREYRDAVRRGQHRELTYRMVAADGREVHVQDRMRVEVDDLGRPVHVRGVMFDVTESKRAEAQARQYLNLVDRITLALVVLRPAPGGRELTVAGLNPEAARVCGTDLASASGRPAAEVLPVWDDRVAEGLAEVSATGRAYSIDELRVHTDGRGARVYALYAFPLSDGAVGLSLQDITDRTMAAEVLRRQSLHDALTGLPNRTYLTERLRNAIRASNRSGEPLSLLVMDLNQFRDVNDALGHDHGDRLLVEVSRRLQRVLRDADTIAYLGGDEFAVLLTADGDAEGATKAATTIQASLEQPFELGGIDVQTSASIGISRYPDHGRDAEALNRAADVAMFQAKQTANGATTYSPDSDRSSVRRLALLGELRRAITEDELELHFQPCLDLRTGGVRSVEALVRWRHPDHGLIPPIEFIELAEISGLIGDLTRWVLTRGVAQAREWADQGLETKVAVNLSVRNLGDPDLVPWLEALLHRDGLDARLLKLEVTESELMEDPATAMGVLEQLRELGTTVSIDDFGTGYSSLAYLKHLPVDELKIDRSFVGSMLASDDDLAIVRSTVDLAHNLGLDTVAEGVEDGPTLKRLAELGCDRAQGYFIARPLTGGDCTAFLRDDATLAELGTHLGGSATGG